MPQGLHDEEKEAMMMIMTSCEGERKKEAIEMKKKNRNLKTRGENSQLLALITLCVKCNVPDIDIDHCGEMMFRGSVSNNKRNKVQKGDTSEKSGRQVQEEKEREEG